jgi:two-component system OmpR family response regulator
VVFLLRSCSFLQDFVPEPSHRFSAGHLEESLKIACHGGVVKVPSTHSRKSDMTAEPTVLLVEDEENVAYVVALALRHSGFVVQVVGTGAEALQVSSSHPIPDIVVLDVMLPDLDGFEVCRRLRADRNDLPVLFLTARDAPVDRLHGLTIGGADYLTKPFGVDALVARVKVILRRVGRSPTTQLLQCGDLSLDDDAHTVRRGAKVLVLSPTEYKMLRYLMRNVGLVVSKAQILDHVWHYDFMGESTVVETHLSTLRKKLGSDGRDLIQTVRGYGYRLSDASGDR